MLGFSPAFHSVKSRETEHAQRGLGTRLPIFGGTKLKIVLVVT